MALKTALVVLIAAGCTSVVAGAQQPAATLSSQHSPEDTGAVLQKYCVSCHSKRLQTGGLALEGVDPTKIAANGELWERVLRKLRAGSMPPVGRPRPDPETYAAVATRLERALDQEAAVRPNVGRTAVIHRLNRAEYRNAVRDLLALDVDVSKLLPADNVGFGFDNNADFLTVSPALLDRYLLSARKLSRLAVGLPPRTVTDTFVTQRPGAPYRTHEKEELPFGMVGGVAIPYVFPVDGEYGVKVTLHKSVNQYIRGLGQPHQLDVRFDGALLKTFVLKAPGTAAPSSLAGVLPGDPAWESFALRADEALEVRFAAKAGPHSVVAAFRAESKAFEGVLQPTSAFGIHDETAQAQPNVESVVISGPFQSVGVSDTPSRRAVFVCRPANAADQLPCAERIVSTLAKRAYRRPLTSKDVDTLIAFYKKGAESGGFEAGIQFAIERILAAPDFLFRLERDPVSAKSGVVYRLDDLDLASRLSFFLWSSIPDDVLLDVAAQGQLRTPAVMARQVKRMLADPRAGALVENFAGQWLQLRNIASKSPNQGLFPDVNDELRDAFKRETELFIESQVRDDRSVLDLFRSNYTFVNGPLARHYGIPDIYGTNFKRVSFTDGRRGGLLGQAGLLLVTSYPNRTSPVLRGKWILETLPGTPPPPPPPNIPALPDKGAGGVAATVRERLENHRKNPVCSACHGVMDPLGFALENFDAVGRWRSNDAGMTIDSSASLPGSSPFDGPQGLRKVLLERHEQFVGTLTEKLLTYALGRGVQHFDMPAVRKIVRDAAVSDYRWSSLVVGIATSTPFQNRMTAAAESTIVAAAAEGR